MITKISLLFGASLFGLLIASSATQDPQETKLNTSTFMHRKLDFTRDVVDGLATEDFDKISKGAQDLMLLSFETDWQVISTPEYLALSSEFRKTTERLRDRGREKNLDGATLAYFEVTLNCIRCHQQLRVKSAKKQKGK